MTIYTTAKEFYSTNGSAITQLLRQAGAGCGVSALGRDGDVQSRGGPADFALYQGGGYEVVERADLAHIMPEYGREAVILADAPALPSGVRDIILDGGLLSVQMHESIGHALELDRALGWEANFSGVSWATPDRVGKLRYGSDLLNVYADNTLAGGLATVGYDDEAVKPAHVPLIEGGILRAFLSSRDTAAQTGLPVTASVRAQDWSSVPMVRITNIVLAPHEGTLASIVADTKDGVHLSGLRSWSIDDHRLNFQFGPQIGYEIKNGKRGRIFKQPTYTGVSPHFWGSLDRVGGAADFMVWGTPTAARANPNRTGARRRPAASRVSAASPWGWPMRDQDRALSLAEHVLKAAARADQAQVTVTISDAAYARFAHNYVIQNLDALQTQITLTYYEGKKSGSVSTDDVSPESIVRLVAGAREIAQRVPPDNGFVSLPKPAPIPAASHSYYDATADATPDDRVEKLLPVFARMKASQLSSSGFTTTQINTTAIANSLGVRAAFTGTMSGLQLKAIAAETSGYAEFYSPDYARLDPQPHAERAAEKATVGRVPATFAPGNVTVLLEPSAFAAALKALTEGMGADSVLEDKDSWMVGRLGRRLFSPNFTLIDDWSHPLFANPPFNVNDGAPTKKLTLIDRGVVNHYVRAPTWRTNITFPTPVTRIFPPTASSSPERSRARHCWPRSSAAC